MAWIGGLISAGVGLLSADSQAGAISDSGRSTAEAAKYASDQQMQMFLQQQANQNAKYNQTRGDLSSLFGGTAPNTPLNYTPNQLTSEQLRAQLLPQFTNNAAPIGQDEQGNPIYNSVGSPTSISSFIKNGGQTSSRIDEAGLQAAINAALVKQSQSSGLSGGTLFGSNYGANNPQLQSIIQQLQGQGTKFSNTANTQLGLFNKFNPQTMAQDIYNKLSALGAPQRTLDRSNLESRLLNQGILTSSPGYNQINSMDQANGQSDLAQRIQAMLTANQTQQQYLQNATGLNNQAINSYTGASNITNAGYSPALQAAGIVAGVPINSSQPIPTGALGVQGVEAAGQANVSAANITNSFWNSLGQNPALQQGISSLFTNLGNGQLGNTGGMAINTTPTDYNGAAGLFAQINGYGGGV